MQAVVDGRVVSLVLSTATVIVVYHLGKKLYGDLEGTVAAGLFAISALPIQLAHFATPDSTTIFFMSTSLLAMAYALDVPDGRRFALAGTLVGLAIGTEYHMVLLCLPLTYAWIRSSVGRPDTLLLGYAGVAGAFLLSNPHAILEFSGFVAAMEHTVRMRTIDSEIQYQGRWDAYGPSWLYVVRFALGYGVGFGMTVWFLVGFIRAAMRRIPGEVLLIVWIVPYFLLVSWSEAKYLRYSAPLLPPLAVFAGGLMGDLTRIRWSIRSLVVALVSGVCVYTSVYDAAYAGLFSNSDPRVVATNWIRMHASPGSRVSFQELPNGLINLPVFVTDAGYRPCFSNFSPSTLDGSMQFALFDDYELEEHPTVSMVMAKHFRDALASNRNYVLAERIHYVPSLWGLRFPIDGSPHDWRYPDHSVTIYRHVAPSTSLLGCFHSLRAAQAALYVPPTLKQP